MSEIPRFAPSWAEVFGEDELGIFAECTIGGVVFPWRWIPPGHFQMGALRGEGDWYFQESPQQWVRITRGFWMGETPVTQAQWKAVMGRNPAKFPGDYRPVEQVSWYDCLDLVGRLNKLVPGLRAALPTEAQWEYACRADTTGAFHDGSPCTVPDGMDPALDRLGWFAANSASESHPVRQKLPNRWGLYDLHGNVWEWCRDAWDEGAYGRRSGITEDPEVIGESGTVRVRRGGSWVNLASGCRAGTRGRADPNIGLWYNSGLRLSAGQELGAAEPPGAERPARRDGSGEGDAEA
jgi:formylglycine-generating enzyme required for sulfatase activity